MKKFESLGRSLSKAEQKKIIGGVENCPAANRWTCVCTGSSTTFNCCAPASGPDWAACVEPVCGPNSQHGYVCGHS